MEKLANKIWNNMRFQEEYHEILHRAVMMETRSSEVELLKDERVIKRLLETSLVFSSVDNEVYRSRAYKIAVAVWKLLNIEDKKELKSIYKLIFARIGNFVAIDLLNEEVSEEKTVLPLIGWYEKNSMELNNTIRIKDNELKLTDFQLSIWTKLEQGMSLSVSAPTSAGKSYIIKLYLLSKLLKDIDRTYIYIVPTRALITQVADDLRKILKEYQLGNTEIITAPIDRSNKQGVNTVYVVTPERARILNSKGNIRFNIVVVDEAQSIEDTQRGVILQDVIDDIGMLNNVQYIFLAPLIKNPESIGDLFQDLNISGVKENESPVFQNTIKVNVMKDKLAITLVLADQEMQSETRQIQQSGKNKEQILALVAKVMGEKESNIIYTTGPAKCEKICEYLIQESNDDSTVDKELKDLSKFIRDYIHQKYILADFIEKGVAFHYGKLPNVIRKNIEELFKKEKIHYITCTSTLLYGVNLPAKNLFIMEPKKDKIPLTKAEFWNLVGRAGRLKEDFNGNIFLVNFSQEEEQYIVQKQEIEVVPSLVSNVNLRYKDLLDFINNPDLPSGQNAELENTFLKLYKYYKQGTLDKQMGVLNKICPEENKLTDENIQNIKNILNEVEKGISLNSDIILKNLTISPYRQQEMFNYLLKKIKGKKVNEIIPLHPLQEGKLVYQSLLRLMKRVHNSFEHLPKGDNQHLYFAVVASKWMRGEHISEMITYALKKSSDKNISSVIRNVMEDVDNKLRFKYVKYISCYIDILMEALRVTNNEDLISTVPNLPLYLELGASAETMINFMESGLSRTTAKVLLDYVKRQNMNLDEVREFIDNVDLEAISISPICIKEITEVRGK